MKPVPVTVAGLHDHCSWWAPNHSKGIKAGTRCRGQTEAPVLVGDRLCSAEKVFTAIHLHNEYRAPDQGDRCARQREARRTIDHPAFPPSWPMLRPPRPMPQHDTPTPQQQQNESDVLPCPQARTRHEKLRHLTILGQVCVAPPP